MRARTILSLTAMACLTLWLVRLWLPAPAIGDASAGVSGPPSAAPGQTVTLLPNGSVLFVGGVGADGPSPSAWLWTPSGGMAAVAALNAPRAWHSATVLPDGTVLVFGGLGSDGTPVQTAELFDPGAGQFAPISVALAPRALHTATLLLDGRVLIAGGLDGRGEPLGTVVLWDARTGAIETFADQLGTPRYGQTATMLPNGLLVLSGGTGTDGTVLTDSEVIDLDAGRVTPGGVFVPPIDVGAPEFAASLPEDGATDVPTTALLGLRFSKPLQVETVTADTVSLSGPGGVVPAAVVAAEGGLLVFVTPTARLRPGTTYTVTLNGAADEFGRPLGSTSIGFTTAGTASKGAGGGGETQSTPPPATAPASADTAPVSGEDWTPSAGWRTGRPDSPWQSLPLLQAAPGVTALAGQVLALNGQPIPGVKLTVGEQTARTDATGRFLLLVAAAGHAVLLIDGGETHGVFEVGVDLTAGRTTTLGYTIWLPRIDLAHAVTIPSPTTHEVVVTTPLIPGLELRIPPGTVIRDCMGKVVHRVSLTPVPLDRPPFPLPERVKFSLDFTAQPGGAYLENPAYKGARVIYPNTVGEVPGWPMNFFTYDPDDRGWFVYGQGRVTADRRQVVPDPGVMIYEFTGASMLPPGPKQTGTTSDAEPVDLFSGAFTLTKTDLVLPDIIPIALARTYQSNDDDFSVNYNYRPFGIGFTHNYELFLTGNTPTTFNPVFLVLPGGNRVEFDLNEGSSYDYTSKYTPTTFAGATLHHYPLGGWALTLRDGTVYSFAHYLLTGIADRFGNTVTLFRDGHDNLTTIVSPHGRSITLAYEQVPGTGGGSNNPLRYRVTKATDSTGRQVNYTYSTGTTYPTNDQLVTVQDARSVQNNTPNVVTRYSYEVGGCGNMTQITDARLITYLTNEYYDTPPPNTVITQCRVKKQTLAGYSTPYQFAYDEVDLVCCEGCPPCGPLPPPFNADTTVTDPRGTQRKVVFTASPGPIGGPYPLTDTRALGVQGEEETITYNDGLTNDGLVASISDALGRKTAFGYDGVGPRQGNVTSITRMAGTSEAVTMTLTYDSAPPPFASNLTYTRLRSIAEPGLPATTLTYYSAGTDRTFGPFVVEQAVITDPTNVQTTVSITPEGQVGSISDALGNTVQFGYEGGDLATITDPNGNTTRRLFDAGGRLRAVIDPLGNLTRYDYDALNNLTQITDPAGKIVSFGYDANSNLTSVTDQRRSPTAQTIYGYDNMDRLSTRTDPTGHAETLANYDFRGNVGTYTDRRGKVTIFSYDRLGRFISAAFGDGSTISVPLATATPPGYDKANRLLVLNDSASGTIVRGYDDFDNLTCESNGTSLPCTSSQPNAVTYTYDAAGRRQRVSLNGQGVACYIYDNADRLWLTSACTPLPTIYMQYDQAGRRSQLNLVANNVEVDYGYEPGSRISSLQYKNRQTGAVLGGLTYTYDGAGNVTQEGGDWARTALPAQTSAAATYDTANRLLSWNGATFATGPDFNGNMQSDGTHGFGWNARNQLRTVSSGSNTTTYKYDAFGRRIQKAVNGSAVVTNYIYDGLNALTDMSGRLLNGVGVDEHFNRAWGQAAYLTDALGSTVALTDTNANVTATYTYEPFGQGGAAGANPFQFTGRENDATCLGGTTPGAVCSTNADCSGSGATCVTTGLDYFRARYYHPTFGRFLSEDPLGIAGDDFNLYSYALNNPTTFFDPLGLAIGDFPPPPPGWDPSWPYGQWPNGHWWTHPPGAPDDRWTAHPEDVPHWRHWDRGADRWPPNSKKPYPGKKAKPGRGQCDKDPNGDAPSWDPWGPEPGTNDPTTIPFAPMDPIPGIPGFPIRVPLRVPIFEF